MHNLQHISQDLEGMLTDIALKSGIFVPVNRDTIKYKNYLIARDSTEGWNVFYLEKRKAHIGKKFLKVSAFALLKLHEKRQYHRITDVLRSDSVFEKNYMDGLYYKNTIKKSKDPLTRDNALWRYEIAHAKARHSKKLIDGTFYSSIA
jgi:hypothetical protein